MGTELIGISAIAMALIGLITKIWLDSSKATSRMSDVIEQNAIASTKLSLSIDANTRVTEEAKNQTAITNQSITTLIAKVTNRKT